MPDHWEFYPSRVDDKSAFIYVDMTWRDAAPVQAAPDFSWLRLYFQQPRDDGLSSQEEFQPLCDIEDAIFTALEGSESANYYVGRTTTGGRREFCVYSGNGQTVESLLGQAMVPFPHYEFETGHQQDPAWSFYREFLLPSRRDMQFIRNQHLIAALQKQQDMLEVPRAVSHRAWFPTEDQRERFVNESQKLGFTLHAKLQPDSETQQWGAVVIRNDPAEYWSIANATLVLHDAATEIGGEYAGWESPVVRDGGDAI